MLLASDAIALSVAAAVALFMPLAGEPAFGVQGQVLILTVLFPVFFLIAHLAGLYHLVDRHLDHTLAEELGPAFMAVTVWTFLGLMVTSALASVPLATGWYFVLWAMSLALVLAGRFLVRRFTQDAEWYRQRVLVIGDSVGVDRVLRRIKRHPECGLDIAGSVYRAGGGLTAFRFDDEGRQELGHRGNDSPADVVSLVADSRVERVVVTGWAEALDERTELIRLLTNAGVYVDIVSGEPEALLVGAAMHHLEGLPIMTVRPPRITRIGRLVKRGVDVTAAAFGLFILAPVLAYVSIRIKLDSAGPVFFRQQRCGLEGESFEIVKFRTMVEGAERMQSDLRDDSHAGNLFKLREDPRITPFGAKLRKSSLDELPQLWNVLKGDMSLVGPRPLPLDEAPLASDHFSRRQNVRPGITGPWQIHGRSDIPFEDMVKLDYTYVSNWSLEEDLRLLIRTVGVVFGGRGAY